MSDLTGSETPFRQRLPANQGEKNQCKRAMRSNPAILHDVEDAFVVIAPPGMRPLRQRIHPRAGPRCKEPRNTARGQRRAGTGKRVRSSLEEQSSGCTQTQPNQGEEGSALHREPLSAVEQARW